MSRPLVVLESVRRIGPATNPYITQLLASLEREETTRVALFGFRRALFGRYDVVHVHWPEVMFGGHRAAGRLARRLLMSLVLLRWWTTRTPVVRTVHNLHRPQGLSRYDHLLLGAFDRLTRVSIVLNDRTPVSGPAVTIMHGHYREWFARFAPLPQTAGRVAFVGLIRRYKGVERLVEQFRRVADPAASLVVAGKPSSPRLRDDILDLAGDDGRISCRFAFLEDADLHAVVTGATLVVLPYRHMHNSGTVLTALSLGRPVLVPDNDVNRDLAREVGVEWVHTFAGEVTAADIERALYAVAVNDDGRAPDLSRREWATTAQDHLQAFRSAIDARRRPGR